MEINEIFKKLAEPFDPNDVEWRAGSYSEQSHTAMALAYLDARAVMRRLDEVVGPENWQDSYEPISGEGGKRGFLCTIHIRLNEEWIGKTDGADESDFEPIKGGLSDAFKRAAFKWGIGRYLYNLGTQWVKAEKNGKYIKLLVTPQLPQWAIPEGMKSTYKATNKTESAPVAKKPKPSDKELTAAKNTIIPASLSELPFVGEKLGTAFADASVGVLVVDYLAGERTNSAGLRFNPQTDEEKEVQKQAKILTAASR